MNALEHKIFPGTEAKVFHDAFFQAQDLVVNALDNVEARRYVDRYVRTYYASSLHGKGYHTKWLCGKGSLSQYPQLC